MRVSLVVVNYGTIEAARSLADSARSALDEVIVVDNASFSADRPSVEAAHPGIRFVWRDTNDGYGAGANAGARLASGDVLIVSNADVEVDGAGLRRLAEAAAGGVAAPRFVDGEGRLVRSSHRREPVWLSTAREYCGPVAAAAARLRPGWHPTLRPEADHYADHDTGHVLGAVMAVDADLFRRLGGFDEGFFLYREETDLCRRAREAGAPVRHVADVVVTHRGDASPGDHRALVAARPAAVRSHYRYIAKHFGPVRAVLAWLIGAAGSLVWVATGPDRRSARSSLSSHLRLLDPRGGRAVRPRSRPA
ncbi:MAG TPA: glycosyltransferase [Acidimicrobiales bacterium]|nr:glycosyltransferase [Acidimicrobiales bacterium]